MEKIAVPLMGGMFSSHFGGAEAFALYTVDGEPASVTSKEIVTPPPHERGVFPAWLRSLGASTVLAGGMGPRAQMMLAQYGLELVIGIEGGEPDALVEAYLGGTLEGSGEPCHDHSFHGCGGHDH